MKINDYPNKEHCSPVDDKDVAYRLNPHLLHKDTEIWFDHFDKCYIVVNRKNEEVYTLQQDDS